MMAQTGAFIVLSRLPSERCGLSRSFAARDFTNRKRAGLQLALVGPELGEIDDVMQQRVGDVPLVPGIMRARVRETVGRDRIERVLSVKRDGPLAPRE